MQVRFLPFWNSQNTSDPNANEGLLPTESVLGVLAGIGLWLAQLLLVVIGHVIVIAGAVVMANVLEVHTTHGQKERAIMLKLSFFQVINNVITVTTIAFTPNQYNPDAGKEPWLWFPKGWYPTGAVLIINALLGDLLFVAVVIDGLRPQDLILKHFLAPRAKTQARMNECALSHGGDGARVPSGPRCLGCTECCLLSCQMPSVRPRSPPSTLRGSHSQVVLDPGGHHAVDAHAAPKQVPHPRAHVRDGTRILLAPSPLPPPWDWIGKGRVCQMPTPAPSGSAAAHVCPPVVPVVRLLSLAAGTRLQCRSFSSWSPPTAGLLSGSTASTSFASSARHPPPTSRCSTCMFTSCHLPSFSRSTPLPPPLAFAEEGFASALAPRPAIVCLGHSPRMPAGQRHARALCGGVTRFGRAHFHCGAVSWPRCVQAGMAVKFFYDICDSSDESKSSWLDPVMPALDMTPDARCGAAVQFATPLSHAADVLSSGCVLQNPTDAASVDREAWLRRAATAIWNSTASVPSAFSPLQVDVDESPVRLRCLRSVYNGSVGAACAPLVQSSAFCGNTGWTSAKGIVNATAFVTALVLLFYVPAAPCPLAPPPTHIISFSAASARAATRAVRHPASHTRCASPGSAPCPCIDLTRIRAPWPRPPPLRCAARSSACACSKSADLSRGATIRRMRSSHGQPRAWPRRSHSPT